MKTTMDNILNKMLVAVMVMIAALMQAVATTHEVGTVADLKSALDGASAGDTIVITASITPSSSDFTTETDGTKSFLTVAKDNLIIMGADESSRKTWEQGAEPVIINCGSVGRFLQNNGNNLTVKNITVTGCKVMPIAEATEAHAILERGENRGKMVLTV
ncbi:MAG: hypothetical protein II840_01300 [Kiritimatiellae bacterium]|nr:hypothetical protein [Kiritimatiellia bacterium]